MLFLYILETIYAISFWILGLISGFIFSYITGLDVRNSCIIFSGIGVLTGAIIGKIVINHSKDYNDEISKFYR